MKNFLLQSSKMISDYMDGFFQTNSLHFEITSLGQEGLKKMKEFSIKGKFLRGALVLLSYKSLGGIFENDILPVAGAMEVCHSGLLMQDDVMDNDSIRRGELSIHKQYEKEFSGKNLLNLSDLSKNLSVCLSDLSIFSAFKMLSDIKNEKILAKIYPVFSQEMIKVGIGQMSDLYLSSIKTLPKKEEILDCYRYKTARYTFSLPLVLGAIATENIDEKRMFKIEEFGEILGMAFQIKDDEIGIYGKKEETGKPVGKDIFERKKTLYITTLFENLSKDEKESFSEKFFDKSDEEELLNYFYELSEKYDIKTKVEDIRKDFENRALMLISELNFNEQGANVLKEFIEFNSLRKK